jgi:DNA replication licensing factor MCM7
VRKGVEGDASYMQKIKLVAERRLAKFTIELDDVMLMDPGLASNIEKNAFRYTKLFAKAIDALLPPPVSDIVTEDIFDVIQAHRLKQIEDANAADGVDPADLKIENHFPPALFRRYEVRFAPRSDAKAGSLRNVVATDLGKLVTVKCIVVRASDIKPICVVATYSCDQCGWELYQEVCMGAGGAQS